MATQVQRAPFAGDAVACHGGITAPFPAAADISVPSLHWLALPGCLHGMTPTDPRLIVLLALAIIALSVFMLERGGRGW